MLDLNKINVLADIASNHRGDLPTFLQLYADVLKAGAVPKVQLYSESTFPRTWLKHLQPGEFVPSVFRPADVELILPYQPRALKIASVEATYWELINECLQTELPVLISTGGMSEDEFIELVERTVDESLRICFMHCVSEYPTPLGHSNINRIYLLAGILDELDSDAELGFSCHNPHYTMYLCHLALSLGATQFEVHIRTGHSPATLDEQCAIIDLDLQETVHSLKAMQMALGEDTWQTPDREQILKWRRRWQK